jgi:hypothetical protein
VVERPRVWIDHVLVAVPDLAGGARKVEDTYGLLAIEGGRHPGVGTGNRIVPLGTSYLELIAVVDPAQAGAGSAARVARAIREGRTFVTWAARTDSLQALRAQLRAAGIATPEPHDGARKRPDGVTLRWRTLALAPRDEASVLPFLIEWDVAPEQHPAATPVTHPSGARGIRRLRLGDPHPQAAAERLRQLLGDEIAAVTTVETAKTAGVLAVELETPGGTVAIT